MRTRTPAALLISALAVLTPAAPALAASHGASHAKTGKHAPHAPHAKPTHKPKAAHRAVVLQGTVTAVDAGASTVSLAVSGGTERARRGSVVLVSVPATAKVLRDGTVAGLSQVVVGDRITVKGVTSEKRAGSRAYTVQRVTAVSAKPVAEPSAEATDEPDADTSEAPEASETPDAAVDEPTDS